MDKIIYHSCILNCNTHKAFKLFTDNKLLKSWLPNFADVEPVVGGKYELFWDPNDLENNSTIGCKITAIEKNKFLSFEWKGPIQFKQFMNNANPLTHVTVFFLSMEKESRIFTEVHLIHTGWRSSKEWEEARLYFVRAWKKAFDDLRGVVNK